MQGDISAIISEGQEHYLQLTKQINRIYESSTYQKIFYRRRSMKEILEERTKLCLTLALSSNRKQAEIDRGMIAGKFGMLFKDAPSVLQEVNWAIVEDRGTVYGFLATDEKFIPHCKACNITIYVSLRGRLGRIGCSNSQCKLKLLAQFQLAQQSKSQLKADQRQKPVKERHSKMQQPKQEKRQMDLSEKELIKRAARKIMQ